MRPTWIACLLLASAAAAAQGKGSDKWIGTWACSQQIPEPNNALPPADLTDATLRQVVHLSLGGAVLRVHLSNAFGTEPLLNTAAHIARSTSPAGSTIESTTDRSFTFHRASQVTIPAGADYLSDPHAPSASSTRASAAITCSPTASAPTRSRASIATSSRNPAFATSSSSKPSTTSALSHGKSASARLATPPSSPPWNPPTSR